MLYTGDYSQELERHLMPAELPPVRIHVFIVESTYGTQSHEKRELREARGEAAWLRWEAAGGGRTHSRRVYLVKQTFDDFKLFKEKGLTRRENFDEEKREWFVKPGTALPEFALWLPAYSSLSE